MQGSEQWHSKLPIYIFLNSYFKQKCFSHDLNINCHLFTDPRREVVDELLLEDFSNLFAPHELASFPRIDRVRVAVQVGRRNAGEHQRAIKLGAEKQKKSFLGLEVSTKKMVSIDIDTKTEIWPVDSFSIMTSIEFKILKLQKTT